MRLDAEGRVHGVEDRGPGPERQVETHIVEGERRLLDLALPEPAVRFELPRRRTLEPEDRLFWIADRKERPDLLAPRAGSGHEILVMRRRISHWSGLVSCASSTST
jgi:hypothetical protein